MSKIPPCGAGVKPEKSEYADWKNHADVSIFGNATSHKPIRTEKVLDVLNEIKTGKYCKQVLLVRSLSGDKKAYTKAKEKLSAVTFAGTFSYGNIDGLLIPTGFLPVDIDHLSKDDTEKYFGIITKDKHTWAVFRSPSGLGLKLLFRADGITSNQDHRRFYVAVEKYFLETYSLEICPAGKAIKDFCFFSFDPTLYLNDSPELFNIDEWAGAYVEKNDNDLPDIEDAEWWDGNIASLPIPDRIKDLITGAQGTNNRSTDMMSVLNRLAYAQLSDSQIYQVFADHPIGDKSREKNDPEKWLKRQIDKGRRFAAENLGFYTTPQEDFSIVEKQEVKEEKVLLNYAVLPAPLRNCIDEICGQTDADAMMVLGSLLGTISAFIGKKFYITEYFQKLYCVLWILAITKSGDFKTTALLKGALLAYLNDKKIREEIAVLQDFTGNDPEGKKQIEAQIKTLSLSKVLLPSRATAEALMEHLSKGHSGVILLSEFGQWLQGLEQSSTGTLKSTLTDFYDAPLSFEYITRTKGSVYIKEPFISIYGVSTVEWVNRFLKSDDVSSGFFARFLLFSPDSNSKIPPALPAQSAVKHDAMNALEKILSDIPVDRVYGFSPDSALAFQTMHQALYADLANDPDQLRILLSPYVKRWSPYVLKLSMIMEFLTNPDSSTISIPALTAGNEIIKCTAASTRKLFSAELGESEFERKCRLILEYLKRHSGKAARLKILSSKIIKEGTKDYDEVLNSLIEQGKIVVNSDGGKPKKEWLYYVL